MAVAAERDLKSEPALKALTGIQIILGKMLSLLKAFAMASKVLRLAAQAVCSEARTCAATQILDW
jgi:hypothetical protein